MDLAPMDIDVQPTKNVPVPVPAIKRRNSAHILERIEMFKQIVAFGGVSNLTESCLDQIRKTVTDKILVKKRIGSSSVNGEAYLAQIDACDPKSRERCKKPDISVKLIPIQPEEALYINDHLTNKASLTTNLWAELLFTKICSIVTNQYKIPNLPLAYSYMICRRCTYENDNLNRLGNGPCLLLLNEFARGGDLASWCKTNRNLVEWAVCYFQIYVSLYFLQKFFNMTHHDLHWGNILVHPTTVGGYSAYKIDGKKYYLPNIGFNFVLWDFGYSRIPGKVEIAKLREYYRHPSQKPRLLVDYLRISNAPYWVQDTYGKSVAIPPKLVDTFCKPIEDMFRRNKTLAYVIPHIFGAFTTKPETGTIIERYDLDSPFKNFRTDIKWVLHDFKTNPIPQTLQPMVPTPFPLYGGTTFNDMDDGDFTDGDFDDYREDDDDEDDDEDDDIFNPLAEETIKVYRSVGDSKLFINKFGELDATDAPRDYYNLDLMDVL